MRGKKHFGMMFVGFVCILLMNGCVTTQPVYTSPLDTSRTFNSSYDKVWGVLVSELSASYPIQTIDKSSGLIATQMVSMGSGFAGWNMLKQYAYEPKALLATWAGGARCRLNFFVQGIDDQSTTVRVTGHFEGFEDNVSKSWHVWQSRGVLESSLLDKVSYALGQ